MAFLSTRLHLVWSTKNREPLIQKEWQPRLHHYMQGILENLNSKPFIIGGIQDHVHLYCALPPTLAIAQLVSTVKSNATAWVRQSLNQPFGWQDGYAAFTMSKSADDDVIHYIRNQEQHHHRKTFQEELLQMLEKFQIP